MEKLYENDRVIFENTCDTVRKFAVSMGSLTAESFDSEKLPVKERPGRIFHDITEVEDEIVALDRPDYFLYRNNNARLFELFVNSGNLTSAAEMQKLQQAMILSERFTQLQVVALNSRLTEHPATRKKNHDSGDREQEALILHPVLGMLQKDIHLLLSPSDIPYFAKIITCRDWSALKVPVRFGCQTNELKCVVDCFKRFNPDLTYANIGRSGLFISKSCKIITAHDLSTSTTQKLKSKFRIEKIIAGYPKKY